MKRHIAACTCAVLAFAGLTWGQPIEKTAECPAFTRSSTYNGNSVTMGTGWQVTPPSSLTNAGQIQNPLTPAQSINCVVVPPGLKAQIIASELTPGPAGAPPLSYLMHFTFDERGRVWAVDPRDYPYTHSPTGNGNPSLDNTNGLPSNRLQGNSRVVILEDTDGDGALDNFKVFHNSLVLPTSIEVVKNGVIVTVPPNVYYLPKSGTNPDTSGTPQIIVSNMGSSGQSYDTHGQSNSLTRGLDNWIYVHNGYNDCATPQVAGGNSVSCGGGDGIINRFKHTTLGSDTNLIQQYAPSNSNNAHGIGQMEDGQFFKSHATVAVHSYHVVRQGANVDIRNASGGSGNSGIDRFYSLTQDRWLWEGNNDAVGTYRSTRHSAFSGHDFYQARLLPQKYWNRFGFTCEGASGLCNQDSLVESGSTWSGHRLYPPNRHPNIFASSDAWTAPLKVRTGPDGALWVLDFYNYLFLHNPQQPLTNQAVRKPLRVKNRVRLYRIIPTAGNTDPVLNLSNATTVELVRTFWNSNFVWRLQAQRLLIEQGYTAELGNLLEAVLTQNRKVDAVGVGGPVLHALWTLEGLKQFQVNPTRWNPILSNLLLHPAWTVRRNVTLAMPATAASYASLRDQCAVNDTHAHVRVQAIYNLVRMPAPGSNVIESVSGLRSGDTPIGNAYTAAGTTKVTSVTGTGRPGACPAYLAASADSAGYPGPVGIHGHRSLQARHTLGYTVLNGGFELMIPHAQLGSGELLVHDLRGRLAFRSLWNKAAGQWSETAARNMTHPVYLYTFRGVDGSSFNGRIVLTQTY